MTRIEAIAPTAGNEDQSLPDPTRGATIALAALLAAAVGAGYLLPALGWNSTAWTPPRGDFNFALFAAFYAAAQIIERVMELMVPFLPVFVPAGGAASVAQAKADRAKIALGLAAVFGVIAASAFGLFFLEKIGITRPSDQIDAIVTGLLIGAGTKPLHDFISLLQNRDNPRTGSTVS